MTSTPNRLHRIPPRTPATPTVPVITDPSLFLIEFTGPADEQGRRQFFAYWLADNIGPALNETGTRGQVFHARPDPFIKRAEQRGMRVELLND